MRVKKILRWFHNRRFRTKILMAFMAVTVLPMLTLGSYIVVEKTMSIVEDDKRAMDVKLQSCISSLEREISKVENSLDTIAFDPNIADALNSEYLNEYEKYYKVTKYFDAVIDTILATNGVISKLNFYVSNSLQNVRTNMRSISELEKDNYYTNIDGGKASEWFFDGEFLQVYRRVYYYQNITQFAVVKASLKIDSLINNEIFGSTSCRILLKEKMVFENVIGDSKAIYRTVPILNKNGNFEIYETKNIILNSNDSVILLGILLFVVFILLIVVIFIISGSLVKRLNYVNASLSSIVENNFEIEIKDDYDDEIGNLAKVVNNMIVDTKRLIEDVYQSELRQKEAEFKALQAQINPHFLYNALSAVNWRAITSDNMEISNLVTMLSKFYRTALNKGKRITTVQNEIENIKAYVDIQLCVHSNSFDVKYNIDESALTYGMPNLIIQPIVENAIEHGIDLLEQGRGYLQIDVTYENDKINITVLNNGVPIENPKEIIVREGNGYGLYNVNKRLELFFGKGYSLEFFSGALTKAVITFSPVENP